MAKVQCYLPDELKELAERAELNYSAILRKGLVAVLRGEGAGGESIPPAPSSSPRAEADAN